MSETNPPAPEKLDYAGRDTADSFAICGFISAACGLAAIAMLFLAKGENRDWEKEAALGSLILACAALVAGLIGFVHRPSRIARHGILLSALGTVLGMATIVVVLMPMFRHTRDPSNRGRCASQLRAIGSAMKLYANEVGGRYPDSLGELFVSQDITTTILICPSSSDTPAAAGPTTRATLANIYAGGHLSYIYLGKGMTDNLNADAILAYEPLSNHQNNGMHVLFGDGHVEWLARREALRMLSELKLGHNPPWDPATQPSATTK